MLIKVNLILFIMASSLMESDSTVQVVDSRDLSNEIPHFDQETHDNFIDHDETMTPSAPHKPYKFVDEPGDVHAQVGTSFTLHCVVSHTNGTVQWTKNNFGLGVDRDLMAYKRYAMVGDQNLGYYSLHIDDVNYKDEGIYQCQFSNQDIQMRSRYATVTVFNEVKVVKKLVVKSCFSGVDDVGDVTMNERYVGNGGHLNWMELSVLKIVVIFGILSLI